MQRKIPMLILLAVLMPASAWAHPFTDATVPEQFSNVPEGTDRAIVTYSEGVELDFSVLKVYDGNGVQIDMRNTGYYQGDNSLVVTFDPLGEGVYTVTSKVLSKVDGHLVDYAFVFAVGDAKIDPALLSDESGADLIYYPEAGAIIPGYIGQTVILGALVASIFVWDSYKRRLGDAALAEKYRGKLMSFMGAGLIAVLASDIFVLAVHSFRLDASIVESLQTSFGTTWILRFAITVALLCMWFVMEHRKTLRRKSFVPMLALALVLIATTTMTSHATASENMTAIVLDYAHNLLAAVWIGGVVFLAFCLFPAFGGSAPAKKAAVAILPKFSIIFIGALGIVIVTGPLLLWHLESDLATTVSSTYGALIAAKIAIAAVMVAMGGYAQFYVQKNVHSAKWDGRPIYKRLHRSLRIEAVLGCMLLVTVALLTNGTLPAGEVMATKTNPNVSYGLQTTEYTEDLRFEMDIFPFTSGINSISVSVTDLAGNPTDDLADIKVKVSNPQRGISPIVIEQNAGSGNEFVGDATFGFAGTWQLDVEVQRTASVNEAISLSLNVKPRLDAIRADITEFDLPEPSQPLYVIYDSKENVWISDLSKPSVWKFSTNDEKFAEYKLKGKSSLALTEAGNGLIWFTDIMNGSIGSLNPDDGRVQTYSLPRLYPLTQNNFPVSVESYDGKIWVSVVNKNAILKFDPKSESWEEFIMPTEDSEPFSIRADEGGRLWFTQQAAGQIGFIDISSGEITEISLNEPLLVPETITVAEDGTIWIAEHGEGGGISVYDPALNTLKKITSPSPSALANSAIFDKYGNVWFAQHTVDGLGVYDPNSGAITQVPIPTNQSWVQFIVAGDGNEIWFAEQKPNKLGKVTITEGLPAGPEPQRPSKGDTVGIAQVAGPIMAAGLVATSLFFVKAVNDKRKTDRNFSYADDSGSS